MFAVVFGKFLHCRLPPHFFVQTEHLFFVIIRRRILDRSNGLEQIAVTLYAIFRNDGGRLDCDQAFINKTVHIFLDGVPAHADSIADGSVTWMALKIFSVLTVHEVSVHKNFAAAQSQREDFIRQRKIIFHRISLWVMVVSQRSPPDCDLTH